jgi:hypothetical protein
MRRYRSDCSARSPADWLAGCTDADMPMSECLNSVDPRQGSIARESAEIRSGNPSWDLPTWLRDAGMEGIKEDGSARGTQWAAYGACVVALGYAAVSVCWALAAQLASVQSVAFRRPWRAQGVLSQFWLSRSPSRSRSWAACWLWRWQDPGDSAFGGWLWQPHPAHGPRRLELPDDRSATPAIVRLPSC